MGWQGPPAIQAVKGDLDDDRPCHAQEAGPGGFCGGRKAIIMRRSGSRITWSRPTWSGTTRTGSSGSSLHRLAAAGKVLANQTLKIVFENEALAVVDGQFGFGQVMGGRR